MNNLFRSLFSFKKPKEIHLRHVLALGKIMEQNAERFYNDFAEQTQNTDVREICIELAKEETRHLKLIENITGKWKDLPISDKDLVNMDAEGKLKKIFSSPPSPSTTAREVVSYALEQERKMVEFYEGFEEEIIKRNEERKSSGSYNPEQEVLLMWKSEKLDYMVEEERSHIAKLSEMLSRL